MASGLPVIASRQGGMAEMVEDGRTGWLSASAGSSGLAEALMRALATSPAQIRDMGREAALGIRQRCDNAQIVERHLELRSQVVRQGAGRSLELPLNLLSVKPLTDDGVHQVPAANSQVGVAIVVTAHAAEQSLEGCFQSLEKQTQQPAAIVIVDSESVHKQGSLALNQARQRGWQVIHEDGTGIASAKNCGTKAILDSGSNPLGFAFLTPEIQLQPEFIATCTAVLQHCPAVGLVSGWVAHGKQMWAKPCPSFPYQWLSNDAASCSVVRTEALRDAGFFRREMDRGYEGWDLANAVMAAGWVAVTVPVVLAQVAPGRKHKVTSTVTDPNNVIYTGLLERFPDLVERDAHDIALLAGRSAARLWNQEPPSLPEQFQAVRRIAGNPRRMIAGLRWTLSQVARRLFQRR